MSPRVRMAELGRLHAPLRAELDAAWARVVDQGDFVTGPSVRAFEAEWSAKVGSTHAVGVQSGTSALLCALRALGVGPGTEVIAPALSFVATIGAPLMLGAELRIVDVDDETLTMDVGDLPVTSRTRAIIPVHLYGQLCAAVEAEAPVLEDASQAHGNPGAGRQGVAATWSFYPAKNLGALGEAGAVTTDDAALAETCRRFRSQGQSGPYDHVEPGLNLRMEGIQAAALSVKLRWLDRWNARRAEVASAYLRELDGLPLRLPWPRRATVWHQFCLRTPAREKLKAHLDSLGIDSQVHYPRPLHRLEAWPQLHHHRLPVAERACEELLSLPVHPCLAEEEVERVIAGVKSFFGR